MEKGIRSGQTTAEYIVLIGIIAAAVFFMGPLFKRGLQTLVKVSADQIGNQQDSDQNITVRDPYAPVEGGGYLVSSFTNTVDSVHKEIVTPGFGGVADITVNRCVLS